MLIRVFCVVQGCVGGETGLLNKGGGEQQASWFSKQQAVEFPQVLTSIYILSIDFAYENSWLFLLYPNFSAPKIGLLV